MWNRILGMWAVAAGISLAFTFFKQYKARPRYIYLLLLGLWAVLWGVDHLRRATSVLPSPPLVPGWLLWALFLLGLFTMLRDSVSRYRETAARLEEERLRRLQGREGPEEETSGPPSPPAG